MRNTPLRTRVTILVVAIVGLTTMTIMVFVDYKYQEELFRSHYENSMNLMNTVFTTVENGYKSVEFHKYTWAKS